MPRMFQPFSAGLLSRWPRRHCASDSRKVFRYASLPSSSVIVSPMWFSLCRSNEGRKRLR